MRFQLVPKSSTLDDLERPICIYGDSTVLLASQVLWYLLLENIQLMSWRCVLGAIRAVKCWRDQNSATGGIGNKLWLRKNAQKLSAWSQFDLCRLGAETSSLSRWLWPAAMPHVETEKRHPTTDVPWTQYFV